MFVWFDCLRPINNLSVIKGWVFLGWTSTKLGLMCLAQGYNMVMPVRLEPEAPRSPIKYSTTEPLHSLKSILLVEDCVKWFLFVSILYAPVNNFSVMSGQVFLVWTSTKQGIKCFAQGNNTVIPNIEWDGSQYDQTGPVLTLYLLVNFSCFSSFFFPKNSFGNNVIRVSNGLDPDLEQRSVGPDLGPSCLQRLSVDDKSFC